MGEANRPVGPLDHLLGNRRIERGIRDMQACKKRGGRTTRRRREEQRLLRGRWHRVDPCAHQLLEGLGNAQWLRGIGVRFQGPRQLERIERVSPRRLVHTEQGWTRELQSKVGLEKLVRRPEAERADVQALESGGWDRPLELGRLRVFAEMTREQKEDRLLVQAPQ